MNVEQKYEPTHLPNAVAAVRAADGMTALKDNLGTVVVRQVSRYADLTEAFIQARDEHPHALLVVVFIWWENIGKITAVFGSRDLYMSPEIARVLTRAALSVVGSDVAPSGLDLLGMEPAPDVPKVDNHGARWVIEFGKYATEHRVFESGSLTWGKGDQ